MAAAGGGGGPSREGSSGGAGMPSLGAAGAPLELRVEKWRFQGGGGSQAGSWLCPLLFEHRHLPHARTGCHLLQSPWAGQPSICVYTLYKPFPHSVPQFPHRGPSL